MATNPKGPLSNNEIEAIRALDTPTIANALEELEIRPRTEGFMRPDIKSITPVDGTRVGYAVTGIIAARHRSPDALSRDSYWNAIVQIPEPRMIVLHDLDYPNPIGSYWGEVQGNTALGFGCVGAVTDGGVRDLKEATEMGFHFWASEVLVSHAYVHALEFNIPVGIGGVLVKPGDLIAADIHGAIQIPISVVSDVPKAAKILAERESIVIEAARSGNASPETMSKAWADASGSSPTQQSY